MIPPSACPWRTASSASAPTAPGCRPSPATACPTGAGTPSRWPTAGRLSACLRRALFRRGATPAPTILSCPAPRPFAPGCANDDATRNRVTSIEAALRAVREHLLPDAGDGAGNCDTGQHSALIERKLFNVGDGQAVDEAGMTTAPPAPV